MFSMFQSLCNSTGAHLAEINTAQEDCFVITRIQALSGRSTASWGWSGGAMVAFALLFYVHGKHLRSCRDGQLT